MSALRLHRTPAARAAARAGAATFGIGLLAAMSFAFIAAWAIGAWRIDPGRGARTSVLGLPVTHPEANLTAIVVLVLAAVGLMAMVRAVAQALRELAGTRRLREHLAALRTGSLGAATVFADREPGALCVGFFRPRIYVSTGALSLLDGRSLAAVLAHEAAHARRLDPLRGALCRVIAHALVFVPGIEELPRRQATLAELAADEHAAPPALARAMIAFASGGRQVETERVDFLLEGRRPAQWPLAAATCLVALAVLVLLTATALLAARTAHGAATLNLPFLSTRPCVMVLALIPLAGALGLGVRSRKNAAACPAASSPASSLAQR